MNTGVAGAHEYEALAAVAHDLRLPLSHIKEFVSSLRRADVDWDEQTRGDSWTRTALDDRSRSLVSVAIAATLGTHEPLRGQLRIALRAGVTPNEIVDLFIHLEAYAGAARAFDSYQIALAVFGEQTQRT